MRTQKGLVSTFLLILMLAVMVDGLAMHDDKIQDITTELNDIDSEKDAEKKDSEKKEKESESEDYLISSLHKQSSDFIRIQNLYNLYYANWCNHELEIITPPPELIG